MYYHALFLSLFSLSPCSSCVHCLTLTLFILISFSPSRIISLLSLLSHLNPRVQRSHFSFQPPTDPSPSRCPTPRRASSFPASTPSRPTNRRWLNAAYLAHHVFRSFSREQNKTIRNLLVVLFNSVFLVQSSVFNCVNLGSNYLARFANEKDLGQQHGQLH